MRRIGLELLWLVVGFGLPFLAMLGIDLLTTRSPLSAGERLLRFEDVCSYGSCIVVPALVYPLVRALGWRRGRVRRRR